MKQISRLLIALALLGTGSLALADQSHRGHDRRGQDHGQRDHHQDRRHVEQRQADHRRHDERHSDRHDERRYVRQHDGRYHRDGYYRGDYYRGGYRHIYPRYEHVRWVRGHRYYGPDYVVRNYGYYRLRPPPRGYRWIRADNDFLLVAITTGVILDMALR
ncbi:MAG TPA: RcnB family protein [Rhodanobacter sp.]|nr:RcnB family protein [Rhodanobacter sp.]